MPWLSWWSASPTKDTTSPSSPTLAESITNTIIPPLVSATPESTTSAPSSQQSETRAASIKHVKDAHKAWLSSLTPLQTALFFAPSIVGAIIINVFFYRYARRIPTAPEIPKAYYRKRSLFGTVTSVGDGDNFRLFHTPLGRWAGWNIFRSVPKDKKKLQKLGTVHIRLAGVDAPEAAHFGRPAQPYSKEALEWLTKYVGGRKVRCYVHRPDQYQRAVATVYVRKWWFFRSDVGLQMIRAGLATVYEAKTGAEFGGEEREKKYRKEEELAKTRARGMWKGCGWFGGNIETPREYKAKYRDGGDHKAS